MTRHSIQISVTEFDLDLFDALDPVEIKQVTLETVVGMVESIQLECEKVLQDHRTRQSNSVTKLTKETN
jgi:hypothetical protein